MGKRIGAILLALGLAGCQPEDTGVKPEARTPGAAAVTKEAGTDPTAAKPASATTCEAVFKSLLDRGVANVRAPDGVLPSSEAGSVAFNIDQRVADGDIALREESVGIVGVAKSGYQPTCTGTLIAPQWVLTAAHCGMFRDKADRRIYISGVTRAEVYVGSLDKGKAMSGGIIPGDFFCHPGFTPAPLNDVALIRLDRPAVGEAPVALPRRSDAPMSRREVGTPMQVFGFGAKSHTPDKNVDGKTVAGGDVESEVLRTGVVALNRPRCGPQPDKIFCSLTTGSSGFGNVGLCRGDSGGPLFLLTEDGMRRQFGVNSYMTGICGRPDVQSGYADVSRHLDWISQVTGLPF